MSILKTADETRAAGSLECWCLHGAVGAAADFREFAAQPEMSVIGTRALDLWRFLDDGSSPFSKFAENVNAEACALPAGLGTAILGYSMGGRLALHALLEKNHPWKAGVMVSVHPGLETSAERNLRRHSDKQWATRAFTENWQTFYQSWQSLPIFAGSKNSRPREPSAIQRLAQRRSEISRSFIDWSLAAQDPLWERLGEIQVPLLWIAGENDEKFRKIAERATAQSPHFQLAIAPDTGHRVVAESPEWLAGTVARFLQ